MREASLFARTCCRLLCCLLALLALPLGAVAQAGAVEWRVLQPGVELTEVSLGGEAVLHAVRIDPGVTELGLFRVAVVGGEPRTAGEWCREQDLAVAVNLGMFREDRRSHAGYLKQDGVVQSSRWAKDYLSALVLGPKDPLLPFARLVDLDVPEERALVEVYGTVVQNLRLIKGPGRNVWSRREQRWSEAAVAEDRRGRLLFLFCRAPFAMAEFNDLLLAAQMEIVRAHHVEGGPEASLSVHAGGVDLDLCGSYETGFYPSDENRRQWALPNVLGVRRRE